MRNFRITKAEYLQKLRDKYRKDGKQWPAPAIMIAEWAIKKGLWEPQPRSLLKQCAREFADAFRQEYYTDPQGRRVRRNHALKIDTHEQLVLWVDIFDATPVQMQAAFQLRRHNIVGDCKHLKTDVDSYNENQNEGEPIQMLLDFAKDVLEIEAAAKAS